MKLVGAIQLGRQPHHYSHGNHKTRRLKGCIMGLRHNPWIQRRLTRAKVWAGALGARSFLAEHDTVDGHRQYVCRARSVSYMALSKQDIDGLHVEWEEWYELAARLIAKSIGTAPQLSTHKMPVHVTRRFQYWFDGFDGYL